MTLSSAAAPLSSAAARSSADGAAGAVVSMVTVSAEDAAPVFPALSVAVAVKECVPWPSTPVVKVHLPGAVATAVPSTVVAVPDGDGARASAVPVSVGVVSRVMSSVFSDPVSVGRGEVRRRWRSRASVSMATVSDEEAR